MFTPLRIAIALVFLLIHADFFLMAENGPCAITLPHLAAREDVHPLFHKLRLGASFTTRRPSRGQLVCVREFGSGNAYLGLYCDAVNSDFIESSDFLEADENIPLSSLQIGDWQKPIYPAFEKQNSEQYLHSVVIDRGHKYLEAVSPLEVQAILNTMAHAQVPFLDSLEWERWNSSFDSHRIQRFARGAALIRVGEEAGLQHNVVVNKNGQRTGDSIIVFIKRPGNWNQRLQVVRRKATERPLERITGLPEAVIPHLELGRVIVTEIDK